MPAVTRIGDADVTHCSGMVRAQGSGNVFCNGIPISRQGDVNKVTDVEAVKRSVRNLMLLNTFEKPFHPEIGGDIRGLLFENMTPLTGAVISRKVEDTILNFEPRARLVGVATTPNFERNEYNVTVYFYVVNAPTELVEVTQILERLR